MLEELQPIPPSDCPDLINILFNCAAKRPTQRALMKHAQLDRSKNTETSRKGLPTFILDVTLY